MFNFIEDKPGRASPASMNINQQKEEQIAKLADILMQKVDKEYGKIKSMIDMNAEDYPDTLNSSDPTELRMFLESQISEAVDRADAEK